MTDGEFRALLEAGRELPSLEYKGPGSWADPHYKARVVRGILAMSNTRDGGRLVLGIESQDEQYVFTGLTDDQIATFREETMQDGAWEYAAPYVTFASEVREHDGKRFVVISVRI